MKRQESLIYHQVLNSEKIGGANVIVLGLASALQSDGRNTLLWVPGSGDVQRYAQENGLSCEVFEGQRLLQPGLVRSLTSNWQMSRRLNRYGPGLVHVHAPLRYGSMRWGLSLSGLKRVVHIQIEESESALQWAFRTPPELIITCARFLTDHVRRALPPRQQERQWIEAVPNAVDTRRFFPGDKAAAKAEVGAPLDTPLLLMLANLAPHKGQQTAIRAVATLRDRGMNVVCWLAGIERDGTAYTQTLRELIQEHNLADRVQLLGQRTDAPQLLQAADFFLLPSTHEGLPLSILEAQATKVPVLAAPTAGVPEVIADGETGFLIAAADAASYAACLQRLLETPELSRRIADQAFERTTREYNSRSCYGRIGALYEETMKRDTAGPP